MADLEKDRFTVEKDGVTREFKIFEGGRTAVATTTDFGGGKMHYLFFDKDGESLRHRIRRFAAHPFSNLLTGRIREPDWFYEQRSKTLEEMY